MESLAGVRVLEISVGQVGPLACEILALLGAEVIRVESLRRLDITRLSRDAITHAPKSMNNPQFNMYNCNKLSIQLNLSEPAGLDLAKKLVQVSDVLLENFSAGTLDRRGLSYREVKSLKPDIVMVSASASGHSGPEAGMLGIAPIFVYLSGLAEMGGYGDGPPFEGRTSADSINSFTLAYIILASLWKQRQTGKGQYIDHSSREGLACLIGDSLMDYTMNGRAQTRHGNLDELMAPHNCYPCRGEDRWVSLAIGSQEEWQAFCKVLGDPDWTKAEGFRNALGRRENRDELDKLVGEWTVNYTPYEVMERLQRVGVAAAPSFTAEDIYTDPHLAQRGLTEIVDHPEAGALPTISLPWKLSESPPQITRHAPLLGEQNEYVFGQLLGLSGEEISDLAAKQIIW